MCGTWTDSFDLTVVSYVFMSFRGSERLAVRTGLWWVSVTAVLPSTLAASYYFTNPKVAAKASAVQAGGAAFALVILLLQTAAQP